MRTTIFSYCLQLLLASVCLAAPLVSRADEAVILNVNGAIGPATEYYIEKGLHYAATQHANVVILQLDTPGGLASALRNIDKAILTSPIPVVTYVTPTGARAASAGTFILYASHIAAMAPGTEIGAASPVNLLSSNTATTENKIDKQNLSTEERKQINDATANLRALAQLRNRNVAWAAQAVQAAASISADEALKAKVIDVVANNIPDLLHQINGKSVNVNGTNQKLMTTNLTVESYNPNWRDKLLAIITDPNIAYILLLIGFYGLFLEFYHPGMILPGIVGAVALLLALYGFELLPTNFVGFSLILLGIIFMMVEVLVSSFGILAVGGIVSFVTGSILLLDVNSAGYHIAWSLIVTMTVFTVGFFLMIVTLSIHAMRRKVVTGREGMVGTKGEVMEYRQGQWLVKVAGEIWQATSPETLQPGEKIRVLRVSGLVLIVEPLRTKKQGQSTKVLP